MENAYLQMEENTLANSCRMRNTAMEYNDFQTDHFI
jgi:hypothetical protein